MTVGTVATDPWSVLDPTGTLRDDPRVPTGGGALSLRGAYRDMVLARRVDTEAIALQRQGELGLWPSMLGQEGAQVGAGSALKPQDVVFPTYREHGVAWCFGVDPVQLLGIFRAAHPAQREAVQLVAVAVGPALRFGYFHSNCHKQVLRVLDA